MGKKQSKKEPATLESKIREFAPNFPDDVQAASDDSLKNQIARLIADDEIREEMRKEDGDLESKRVAYQSAAETYTVPLKENKLKRKLLVQILTQRGKL